MPVVCYMTQFGNWKQSCLEVFVLINCIARSINCILPKTPIARQTFKLYKSSHIISLVPSGFVGSVPGCEAAGALSSPLTCIWCHTLISRFTICCSQMPLRCFHYKFALSTWVFLCQYHSAGAPSWYVMMLYNLGIVGVSNTVEGGVYVYIYIYIYIYIYMLLNVCGLDFWVVSVVWSGQFMAVVMAFNLWIGPGLILSSHTLQWIFQ
jgi:hypothetical protein